MKFFAKSCAPCRTTLPAAQKLHEAYDEVAFIGISMDDSEDDTRSMVAEFGLTFPVVYDGHRSVSGRFRVSEIPMTFVADRTGVVRWIGGSAQDEDALKQAIQAAR